MTAVRKRHVPSRSIAWLLALLLPFQALTALYLDVHGPLHFHVAADDHDHHGGHAHAHGDRHHHHANDVSVVRLDEENRFGPLAALEHESNPGWSATMLAALTAGVSMLQTPNATGSPVLSHVCPLRTRFPSRLERPPRSSSL
jgi:hypothetical protein